MQQCFAIATLIVFLFSCCSPKKDFVPDMQQGLVAQIMFDGNVIEQKSGVVGNNFGALFTENRKGEPNRALQFNRADSAHVNFGDLDSLSFTENVFTICFWAKVSDTSKRIAVLSKRGPFGAFEYSIDNYFFKDVFTFDNWRAAGGPTIYGVDPMQAAAKITLNQWQHFAFVGDGSAVKVYLNGTLQSGMDLHNEGVFFDNTEAPFVVGNGGGWAANHYFDGCIDDIMIYKSVLDETTIKYIAKM